MRNYNCHQIKQLLTQALNNNKLLIHDECLSDRLLNILLETSLLLLLLLVLSKYHKGYIRVPSPHPQLDPISTWLLLLKCLFLTPHTMDHLVSIHHQNISTETILCSKMTIKLIMKHLLLQSNFFYSFKTIIKE